MNGIKEAPQLVLLNKMSSIKPGSIKPEGWLKRWTEINANGWLLHYAKSQDIGVYGKMWNRNETSANIFDEKDQTLTLCDYTAYFADALVRYAQILPGTDIAFEWESWLQKLLASQDSDGYIGAFVPNARWQHWLEIFSQSLVLDALFYYYEASGDSLILDACKKAVDLIIQVWNRPNEQVCRNIFSGHGTVIIRTANKLYELTHEYGYLLFGQEVFEEFGHTQEYLTLDDAVIHKHNAVETEHVGFPAMMYEYCGDDKLLHASVKAWEMMNRHLAVDGTPHGGEMMTHKGGRINCEHCSAVEWVIINATFTRITGEVKYADAVELAIFNGYPGAKSPDGLMVGYSHSPNQLVASEWGMPHNNSIDIDWWSSRQFFSSAHEPLCCNANGPRGIPYFIDSMIAYAGEGLSVLYYSPCKANFNLQDIGQLKLSMKTEYPFEDEVWITLQPEHSGIFPVKIRIPGWCSGAQVEVNGEKCLGQAIPGTFTTLSRKWEKGDGIHIKFEVPIRVSLTKKPEFGVRVACATVQRGPIVYALPVEEDWKPFIAPANGPGQGIVSSRVFMKEGAAWNYALLLDPQNLEADCTLERLTVPEDSRPWDNHPCIGIKLKGRRVLNWYLEGDPEHPMTPGAPFNPIKLSHEIETIILIPYGNTRLRMTYLPIIEKDQNIE